MAVSVLFATSLLSELERRGLDAVSLLQRADLAPARLQDPSATLELEECESLCAAAVELSGDETIGLATGLHAPPHVLQAYTLLLLTEETLRAACNVANQYTALLADGLRWETRESEGESLIRVVSAEQPDVSSRCLRQFALGMMIGVGRRFFAGNADWSALHLQLASPRGAAQIPNMVGLPVLYAQGSDALVVATALLDGRQPHADGETRAVAHRAAAQVLEQRLRGLEMTTRVRRVLAAQGTLTSTRVEDVARRAGVSVRTLRRRLSLERSLYSALVEEARYERACRELRAGTEIKVIAELAGFSDTTAFHRAFKRWTGVTPKDYVRVFDEERTRLRS